MITNVGRAHLQGFGSFEGVKKTKGELYDFIKAHDGLIFLNESNPDLVEMARQREMPRIETYGRDGDGNITGSVTKCDPFLNFTWEIQSSKLNIQGSDDQDGEYQAKKYEVKSKVVGSYNIDNMLAAITIGLHFGVSPEQINHALENYTPSNDRSELTVTEHNHLVVDAYNANPSSMAAALENFRLMDVPNKMAILGDMRELGKYSDDEHQKVVDTLKEYNINNVWLVGPEFSKTKTDFRKFANVDEVKAEIARQQPQGHYILIKGSNGIRLFELPQLL